MNASHHFRTIRRIGSSDYRPTIRKAQGDIFSRLISSQAGQSSSKADGRPTHTRSEKGKAPSNDLQGLGTMLGVFVGGFAITVTALSMTDDKSPTRLLPNRYKAFRVLDSQKYSTLTSSNSSLSEQCTFLGGNNDHAYLAIEPPTFIAPPKLNKEDAFAFAASGGSPASVWRIHSLHLKEPSLQIERPYTPLYSAALEGPRGTRPIELLIKKYSDGEVGKYAHSLRSGDIVELRGPEVSWQGEKRDELIMIVGGTGITPAFQLLTSIIENPNLSSQTKTVLPHISLLYAAPKVSSLLLLPEIARLQELYGDRLHVRLLAEDYDIRISQTWLDWLKRKPMMRCGFQIHKGGITSNDVHSILRDSVENQRSRHILVCGPDGMIAHVAGAKSARGQGHLAGILKELEIPQEHVYKL